MATVYVIQTGQTTWEAQGRTDSAAGVPLTDSGIEAVRRSARELADQDIAMVYAGAGEAERQSAELIAREITSKVKTVKNLRELDYGLWQGLTVEEIHRRQPKLYRQWVESPASVRPPNGEALAEGRQRLRKALKTLLKHNKNAPVLLVLRPVILGLLRCLVYNHGVEEIWQNVDPQFTWTRYEMDEQTL